MDMGSMSSSDGADACMISMLWNWYTIDACFLTSSWRITNQGMFAASCIGVAAMSFLLEGLRRISREYDSSLQNQWRSQATRLIESRKSMLSSEEQSETTLTFGFRASPLQQLIRALLHAAIFTLAYIIMLLFMYFNGYIIISIIIGAAIGKYLCDWPTLTLQMDSPIIPEAQMSRDQSTCCS